MFERTTRPLTEAETARLRLREQKSLRQAEARPSPDLGLVVHVAAFGAVAGMLVALLIWSLTGRHGELGLWLLTGGVVGAAWLGGGLYHVTRQMDRDFVRGLEKDPVSSDSQATVIRCGVSGAVELEPHRQYDAFILNVGDGNLLAVRNVIADAYLEPVGFPHERFEMVLHTGPQVRTTLLSYRGEGEMLVPIRTIPLSEADGVTYGLDWRWVEARLFRGTLDTCLDDLQDALAAASDDQIPSKSA